MKPSERIDQIINERMKAALSGRTFTEQGRFNLMTQQCSAAIIDYLDEIHRFEHPDWEAECARIAAENPGVVKVSITEREDHDGDPALFATITLDQYIHEVSLAIIQKVQKDLSRFTSLFVYTRPEVSESDELILVDQGKTA